MLLGIAYIDMQVAQAAPPQKPSAISRARPDYSTRSGFPRPAAEMRGVAPQAEHVDARKRGRERHRRRARRGSEQRPASTASAAARPVREHDRAGAPSPDRRPFLSAHGSTPARGPAFGRFVAPARNVRLRRRRPHRRIDGGATTSPRRDFDGRQHDPGPPTDRKRLNMSEPYEVAYAKSNRASRRKALLAKGEAARSAKSGGRQGAQQRIELGPAKRATPARGEAALRRPAPSRPVGDAPHQRDAATHFAGSRTRGTPKPPKEEKTAKNTAPRTMRVATPSTCSPTITSPSTTSSSSTRSWRRRTRPPRSGARWRSESAPC